MAKSTGVGGLIGKVDLGQFVQGIKDHDWKKSSAALKLRPNAALAKVGETYVYTLDEGTTAAKRYTIRFRQNAAADELVKTGEERDTLLYVRTDPPGAKILLDGKELGVSDAVFPVDTGVCRIVVELDGHQPEAKEVKIQANRITRVELALKRKAKAGKSQSGESNQTANVMLEVDGCKLTAESIHLYDDGRIELNSQTKTETASAQEAALRELVAKFVGAATKGEEISLKHLGPRLGIHEAAEDMREVIAAGGNVSDIRLVRIKGDKALVATAFADITDRKYKAKNPWCVVYCFIRQNDYWVLNDIDLEDADGLDNELRRFDGVKEKSVRIRYKLVQGEAQAAEAKAAASTVQPSKRVHLPDADTKDAEIVLDLASGQKLKAVGGAKSQMAFTPQGKGDLAFDRVLVCLRGGSVKCWSDGRFDDLPAVDHRDDATAYKLPTVPCRLLVMTAEKKQFDVTILEVTNDGGLDLEYKPADAGAGR